MTFTKLKVIAVVLAASVSPAGDIPEIPPAKFDEYHALIRPWPGEYGWRNEIPWLLSVREAREKAAQEGKPVLMWVSANSPALGHT